MRRFENAGPGSDAAAIAPRNAAIKAAMERCPKSFGIRLARIGSRTIRIVPAMVRMVSGAKRRRSSALGTKLTGMGVPSADGHWPNRYRDPKGSVTGTLTQNFRVRFRNGRQKGLREHAHP